jgi:hypothetical protein
MKLKPNLSNLPELLTYQQAGDALGLTKQSIMKYVKLGQLETFGIFSRKRVKKSSLLTFVHNRVVKPAQTPAEKKAKRAKRRDAFERNTLYRCATLFMKGARPGTGFFKNKKFTPEFVPKEGDRIGNTQVFTDGQWRWA